jgi:hypothetical protein
MINLMDEIIRDRKAEKELECKLEYDLIDTEEAYHISHRFPRRFDFLSDWERWRLASAYAREHELEMRDLGRGMTYKEFDIYRNNVMSRFKVPKEWW